MDDREQMGPIKYFKSTKLDALGFYPCVRNHVRFLANFTFFRYSKTCVYRVVPDHICPTIWFQCERRASRGALEVAVNGE